MKKTTNHHIAEVPCRRSRIGMTIGIDLGDVWSHYCTLNEEGEVVDRGRFRTTPKAIDKWFTDVPHARVAMEAGTHSIWISEQLQELGHEVIVANVRELRAISHSDRKSDQVDAEKLARYARLDPEILRPISHRTVDQQEALTLIRAKDLLVRLADDHFTVLKSVVPMLKPFFNVVGTASDGKGAVEAEGRLHPDVVILDISMPVMSGIDAAKQMRKQGSNARIVFLTVHEDTDILAAAKAAGGKGYVVKSRLGTDLIPAIKDALAGKDFVSKFSQE